MAEGEFWQDTKRRRRQQRIETIVAGVIGGMIADEPEYSTKPHLWADAIIEESDRREDEAAP